MTEMYIGGQYAESNPSWHAEDAPWKAGHVASILRDNWIEPSRIAEVGCGTGEILARLAEAFPAATFDGYDVSPQAMELAASRTRPGLEFHLDDPLGKPGHDYDAVLVADVVEHVEDCFAFVRGVKELGTWKVFHIPLDLSAQSVARMWPIMNLRAGVGHIHYFTKDTALALLRDCDYEIMDWRYTASRLELPNQALSSRVVATPRRLLHGVNPDLAVRLLGGYSLLVLAR